MIWLWKRDWHCTVFTSSRGKGRLLLLGSSVTAALVEAVRDRYAREVCLPVLAVRALRNFATRAITIDTAAATSPVAVTMCVSSSSLPPPAPFFPASDDRGAAVLLSILEGYG